MLNFIMTTLAYTAMAIITIYPIIWVINAITGG